MTPERPASPAAALEANAWPFAEARALLERLGGTTPAKRHVLFQTGYGPSGLPHIGTFGEVVRTSMVRNAFAALSDLPTRLFTFSDDMDGLRKVPDNFPNKKMLENYVEKKDASGTSLGGVSLTSIPDPFGTHESLGAHNNARLRAFLDEFEFDYEFVSATECYRSGRFNTFLLRVLEHYKEVTNVVLPTLGEQRQKTYCPFLPVSPKSGTRSPRSCQGNSSEARNDCLSGRGREPFRITGHRRSLQATMASRLGHAVGGAGRRL